MVDKKRILIIWWIERLPANRKIWIWSPMKTTTPGITGQDPTPEFSLTATATDVPMLVVWQRGLRTQSNTGVLSALIPPTAWSSDPFRKQPCSTETLRPQCGQQTPPRSQIYIGILNCIVRFQLRVMQLTKYALTLTHTAHISKASARGLQR